MRPIDANEFKRKLIHELNVSGEYTPYECGLDDAICWLDDAPTIEAEPVVHGEWLPAGRGIRACSQCNHGIQEHMVCVNKHCPNCGAKMKGGGQK